MISYTPIITYNLEEGPPFGEERFAQKESPAIVCFSGRLGLELCVSWGACKKQGASKLSQKHVKIGGHYRQSLFECLLARGPGTLPAEAVVDASKMQGATIAVF